MRPPLDQKTPKLFCRKAFEKISILTVSSKKKDMTNRSCLSFWVSRAVGRLPPPPRFSPAVKTLVRRTRAAAQKGRLAVFLLTVPKVKISILTVPSKTKGNCKSGCRLFWVLPPEGRLHSSIFQCSGRQSRPCAKVFTCGENACTTHPRRRPEGRWSDFLPRVRFITRVFNSDFNRPFHKIPRVAMTLGIFFLFPVG